MRKLSLTLVVALILPLFISPRAWGMWTSRERVVSAAKSMDNKAQSFYRSIPNHEVAPKALLLSQALETFYQLLESGIPFEEAEKEFERLGGVYHHVDRKVSDAFHLNFVVMLRWRGVEWAWEPVQWNMYGTVP